MCETLDEMARTLFQSWFVDFEPVRAKMEGRWQERESLPGLPAHLWPLFPDRLVSSDLGDIPEGWTVGSLGEMVELAYGKALKAVDRNDGEIPVYGSNGQVGWHDAKLVDGPGIVVGRKGNPGAVTWVYSDFFPIDTTFYVVPKNPNLSLTFLYFALAAQELSALTADSAVPGLNRKLAYMNQQIAPEAQLVRIFDNLIQSLFTQMKLHKAQSTCLINQRDALLPALLPGKVKVELATISMAPRVEGNG